MLDPLSVFLRNTFDERGLTPIPLVSTDHDVVIAAGLAVVTTHRLFKNVEAQNIEAVLTFPLPVLATLFELTAEVDGRKLKAKAQARAEARRTYEDAIDRGKSAVLHEELLRGVHMISVANIQSGGEVKVTTKWALPLSVTGGRATIRIPQTVGDIYGRSNLAEADDILSGGARQPVLLSVRAAGNVEVIGADLVGGHARLMNSRPIDIVSDIWEPVPLMGNTTSGRAVKLTLSPQIAGNLTLSVAVLIDHSGSMAENFASEKDVSAHDAAKNGLVALAERVEGEDFIDLWEFDTSPTHVGTAGNGSRSELSQLVETLSPPRGGTEIGRAIDTVLQVSNARDLLVLTDGLSHDLDVLKLSQSGRRISVILIGEDSLEAQIGSLAAATGGDVFIATIDDLDDTITAAIDGLRRRHSPLPSVKQLPEQLECIRNNTLIRAEWSKTAGDTISHDIARAAVAVASSLISNCGDRSIATNVAVEEGLVTHLTSLVLVDEASPSLDALPALRKVALPSRSYAFPSAASSSANHTTTHLQAASPSRPRPSIASFSLSATSLGRQANRSSQKSSASPRNIKARRTSKHWGSFDLIRTIWTKMTKSERQSIGSLLNDEMKSLARQIDWGHSPRDLILGDLSELSGDVAASIRRLAAVEAVAKFAELNGLTSEVLVIGLLARSIASEDRRANRVWKAISDLMTASVPEELAELELQIIASS